MELRENQAAEAAANLNINQNPAAEAQAETSIDELAAVSAELPDEEAVADELVDVESRDNAQAPDRASLMEKVESLAQNDAADITADEIARLKQQFYVLHTELQRDARRQWVDEGNDAEAFVPVTDPDEERFKELLATIKEKKAEARRRQEAEELTNLERKRALIKELNELSADTDAVGRVFNRARDIQTEFAAIGNVPPTEATAVWKEYQDAREHYYDQLKINKELRDYDFKKNLAEKELLCEQAEELVKEEDVVTSFRRLQELHDKWRQVGPVAKELRESIWNRFKDASAEINKRYQAHFEERKAREAENEAAKTAICERVESLDFSSLKNFAAWDEMTKQIMEAQADWKKIGFASRKSNNALFSRFRAVCDAFFAAKATFFKEMKESQADNLARKTALCERAEALKDSTDWRKTTEELVALQKEWKSIGAVARKSSDAVWQRFMAACDYFFDRKKQNAGGTRKAEQANLRLKQEIIDKLAEMTAPDAPAMERAEAQKAVGALREQWNEIGHVPFKVKDEINQSFRDMMRQAENKFDLRGQRARMARFEDNVKELEGDASKLGRERDRLIRAWEQRKAELATFRNNMGFLSSKSKSGNSLLAEMERRAERLQQEIDQLRQKIDMVDSKL
ncbi:MAG: DUF349 domain-containing protein [Bacteroides sp.]|nr:DUF349 domain-containing protein [Bacteroides sp.]